MSSARLDIPPNPNDPGTWTPQRQRMVWAVAFLGVLALAWVFWLSDELTRWTAERDRESVLRDEHMVMVQRIKALQSLEARKVQLEDELGRLQKQLPAAAEMEGVLRGITAAGRVRGLQFELFRPAPIQLQDGYAEMPVALRVVGGYHDIGAFLGDLARLPRIVTLHNIVLMPQSQVVGGDRAPVLTGSRLLVMEATLRTYRALDAQEATQQRRRNQQRAAGDNSNAPAGTAGTRSTAGATR